MSTTVSYKLPNLTALARPFELRTNPNCRAVSLASEKWVLEPVDGTETLHVSEYEALRGAKTGLSLRSGLLAALCYPTCDFPQLRLVTDFLGLLVCSNDRVMMRRNALPQWVGEDSDVWNTSEGKTGLAIANNVFFRRLTTRLSRLVDHAHPSWVPRFNRSTHALRVAQFQITKNRQNNVVPDLESYFELRRDSSGLRMMFDLIEIAEGLILPMEVVEGNVVGKLGRCAMDIVAWSMDILSYKLDHSRGNEHNLIAILISEKGFSLQGAISFAGNLVKQSIDAFIATEMLLMTTRTSSSLPTPFASPDSPSSWDDRTMDNVRMYVQGLRDSIAGSIHWAYDGEMFFGNRGEDVRAFGWVFLSQSQNQPVK